MNKICFAQISNGVKFNYRARTKEGKVESGEIEAYSKEDAVLLLQKYNIFVTSLEEKKVKNSIFNNIEFTKKVSKKDLAIFFRQLSLMLESRVPIIQSLSSLVFQTHKKSFREAIVEIASLVEEGLPLSEALDHYPFIFGKFYVNLIKSGEASGKIPEALYYVSDHLEKESDIAAKVRQAMIYPIFVISVLLIVIIIMIKIFMPKIAAIIEESGITPPLFTVMILNFYAFLEHYWWALIAGLLLLISLGVYYANTKNGHDVYNKVSLKTPFIKEFLKKVFLVRFCSNISTLLIAGVSINNALKITEDTVNNIVYKKIISEIGQKVSEGEKISLAMAKHQDYFPLFVVQMVRVGEETGKLDKVLVEVVNFHQKEIERSIGVFSALLEPVIIIILGIVVTILAVSVLSSLYGTIGIV